ncbi:MAG TPA: hypothetical protein VEN47_00290, partial [Myxococcota bacterium]|nr:hypothetical protein [Myxococcota bacterium]
MALPDSAPDLARLAERLADAELAFAARFWDGALHLDVGGTRSAVRFAPGSPPSVELAPGAVGPRDVCIAASREEWQKLLAAVPVPFYQDVYGAALHHPVSIGGDPETIYAYYPA